MAFFNQAYITLSGIKQVRWLILGHLSQTITFGFCHPDRTNTRLREY